MTTSEQERTTRTGAIEEWAREEFDRLGLAPDRRPKWKIWLARLFEWEPCALPGRPPSWKEVIVTRSGATLTWKGRLLVLWSGRVEVETRTVAEHECGKTATCGVTRVLPPRWLERQW